jgi:hypothetical protein
MRRVLWACSLAAVAGCSGEAEKPEFAKSVDGGGAKAVPVASVAGDRPTASDPAALRVVEGLVLKHTANEPKRLDRLRTYGFTRKGKMLVGGSQRDVAMRLRAVWPDRQRADWTVEGENGRATPVFCLRGGTSWQAEAGGSPTPVDPVKQDEVSADLWAEWVVAVLPLAEPGRIAGPPPAGEDPATVARVWLPGRPPVVVAADPATGLLARVRYEVKVSGRVTARTLALSNHQPVGGVLLPHLVELSEGREPGAVYTSVEYETPSEYPAATFEKP